MCPTVLTPSVNFACVVPTGSARQNGKLNHVGTASLSQAYPPRKKVPGSTPAQINLSLVTMFGLDSPVRSLADSVYQFHVCCVREIRLSWIPRCVWCTAAGLKTSGGVHLKEALDEIAGAVPTLVSTYAMKR